MNDRPNRRRGDRGSRMQSERMQERPAERSEGTPRRSGRKRKNGKALYYTVLVLLLGDVLDELDRR